MGVVKFFSSSSFDNKTSENNSPKQLLSTPDPKIYRILREKRINNFLILKINYPNSTNYEGNKILIQSFCDTVGTSEHNRIIVERRANEIKKRIVGFGISESLIVVVLHGEEDAIEPNDAENRKSIISVINKNNLYYNGPVKISN